MIMNRQMIQSQLSARKPETDKRALINILTKLYFVMRAARKGLLMTGLCAAVSLRLSDASLFGFLQIKVWRPLQNNPSKPVRLTLICKRFNYRGSRYRCVKPFSNAGPQFTFIDKMLSKQDVELCAEFQMKRQAAEMRGWTVRWKLTGRKRYKML